MLCFPSRKSLPHDEESIPSEKNSSRKSRNVEEDDDKLRAGEVSAQMLSLTLETMKTAGEAVSIPFLPHAASVALLIIETVQNVKDNKEQFQQLAEECCALVYTLYRTKGSVPSNEITVENVRAAQSLDNTISEISRFASRSASRKWWQRFLRAQSDAEKIGEYRRNLNHALTLFNLDQTQTIIALASRCYEMQRDSQLRTPESLDVPVKLPPSPLSPPRPAPAINEGGVRSTETPPTSPFPSAADPNTSHQPTDLAQFSRGTVQTPESNSRIEARPVPEELSISRDGEYSNAVSPSRIDPPGIPARPPPVPMFASRFPFNGTISGNIKMTNIGGDYNVKKVNKSVVNTNSNNTYVNGRLTGTALPQPSRARRRRGRQDTEDSDDSDASE